jgi:endonuclease/exonuclease/phosphatase family metal-dependent hydrolase
MSPEAKLRVATYNIHKGVQGLGLASRLEIHNLGHAVEQLDADIVCLQEVRKVNRKAAQRFARWPEMPQAEFLAPEGYTAVYETNAYTRHGEHGNALLTRWPVLRKAHRDISDHRFEQRGLLHAVIEVDGAPLHAIVVHLGLIKGSRVRQVAQLRDFIEREIPPAERLVVAGDFNDWGARMRYAMNVMGLRDSSDLRGPRTLTYPSRLPLTQLDFIYARHLKPVECSVPRGPVWSRMSDHLPLVTDFSLQD